MEAVVRPDEAVRHEAPPGQPSRWRPLGSAVVGPGLIAACVLFALRGFVFSPLLTNQHPDILAFWLPRLSFLGRSIASGHVPLWNPFEMAGTRFAADPQSGWLYGVPMLLFSTLSPGAGMRAFIAINPILAGLGLYWFLRKERLPRTAATAGGLALAMPMSTSIVVVSMPFAGAIAWTTIVLVGASGYRTARSSARQLAWLALAALAWSQVAAAHMSHGLAICTLLAVAYLAADVVAETRSGGGVRSAGRAVGFLAFLPLASLAVLIPRLAMISTSSLHSGYGALPQGATARIQDLAIKPSGVFAGWPLSIGTAPGAFVGAVTLLCVPLAVRARRHRALVWAFGSAAVLSYLLTLNALVTAGWFRALLLRVPYGNVYLHNPGRLRYVWMVVVPVLAAVGIAGLLERRPDRRTTVRFLGAGTTMFLVLPLVLGGDPLRFLPLVIGIALATPLFLAVAHGHERARWARFRPLALVALLAIELLGSAVYSQAYQGGTVYSGLESGAHPSLVPQALRWPPVFESEFLRPTPFVRILRSTSARYLTWVQPAADFEKGYLFSQQPQDWPALAMERGTLFGIYDVLGYNPVQLARYWSFIRQTNRLSVFYNASVISDPTLSDMRLLGARYLIRAVGQNLPPGLSGNVVSSSDGYELVEVSGWEPRASVVPAWSVAGRPLDALHAVVRPGFDPARQVVLERDPGIAPTPGGQPGLAAYAEAEPEDARITVDASAPSIVLVRNAFDAGWSATVDGRPAPVLVADGFLQGVAVSAGHHDVRLVYRDPTIARVLAASAVVWILWAAAFGFALRRRARKPEPGISLG